MLPVTEHTLDELEKSLNRIIPATLKLHGGTIPRWNSNIDHSPIEQNLPELKKMIEDFINSPDRIEAGQMFYGFVQVYQQHFGSFKPIQDLLDSFNLTAEELGPYGFMYHDCKPLESAQFYEVTYDDEVWKEEDY